MFRSTKSKNSAQARAVLEQEKQNLEKLLKQEGELHQQKEQELWDTTAAAKIRKQLEDVNLSIELSHKRIRLYEKEYETLFTREKHAEIRDYFNAGQKCLAWLSDQLRGFPDLTIKQVVVLVHLQKQIENICISASQLAKGAGLEISRRQKCFDLIGSFPDNFPAKYELYAKLVIPNPINNFRPFWPAGTADESSLEFSSVDAEAFIVSKDWDAAFKQLVETTALHPDAMSPPGGQQKVGAD